MPTRTRWYSGVCSAFVSDFNPLCPALPPPSFTRSSPAGISSSSCTATIRSASMPCFFATPA